MTESTTQQPDAAFGNIMDTAIRLGVVFLLASWCFQIVRPFVSPVIWGIVLAVALAPLCDWLEARLGGRRGLSAAVVSLSALALLLVPTILFAGSSIETVQGWAQGLESGAVAIPPPSDGVREWPFIGERLHEAWSLASRNLEGALVQFSPQLKSIAGSALTAAAGAGSGLLQFAFSILVAGLLLANAVGAEGAARSVAARLIGERGSELVTLSAATVRSVAQGVLGIAVAQAVLAGVGLVAVGVPAAGVWVLLVLVLAVVQLPPFLVLGPIAVYVFSMVEPLGATLFAIWSLFVSVSDAFLKPLLLGRGLEVPMLVILVGAIGGMLLMGIIGLFLGAVILALGYEIFMDWMNHGERGEAVGG